MKAKAILLTGAIALVVIGCILAAGCTSQDSEYQPARVYDLENHYFSEEFFNYLANRTDYPMLYEGGIIYDENAILPIFNSPSLNSEDRTIDEEIMDLGDGRLSMMDNAGLTTAVISAGQGLETLPKEDAVRQAQIINNQVAEAMKKYPGRILGTIALPTPYVNESITELERAVNELGLQYWHTNSNYGNEHLYDEKFEPLIAKCAELNVPIYLHPTAPSSDEFLLETGKTMASAMFAYGVDSMRTSLRLILNGVFDKYPNLQMIIAHLGEYYPYVLDRMDNRLSLAFSIGANDIYSKHLISYYFKNGNIFVTTSGIYDPDVVTFAIDTIGIDSILMGTDYPYENVKSEIDFIKSLPISDEDKDKILYKNAETYILKDRTPKSA